jgi:hypothetical protein
MLLEPEIKRRIRIRGRDDVPAGAAIAQVIERGETPRDVIRRVKGGRAGGDKADALGRLRQSREQRERLERRRGMALLSASIGIFSTAIWSAMKKASNFARSSFWIDSLICAKLKFISGHAPG